MSRIRVPVDDLTDTMEALKDIRERIDNTARLYQVGSPEDVGDSDLATGVDNFDKAWVAGHERVQDNVDTFKETTQGIVDNFTQADQDTSKGLDDPA
ncbi:hypothetical protein [Streptomyces purpurascens]|uniref:Uncharacterized protein n=1 Tax=Streptomyces purpurascens TaxID=1924 RepID=A0ABZ1MFL7_STREF|nr:hypothetical protein [Streptomyces purpurascens]MCE7047766.1 hypothetical protein [Streptomyces purpurascens]GHA16761.1 hypothetical protein GCM10010303_28420 [Streptomyces purpurascens]